MNKCSKCGTEFEGKFCPECGTPSQVTKVCPQCGAQLNADVKFCNNCGYSFYGQTNQPQVQPQAQPAPERVDWKQNQVLHKILQYAPLAIFALWALLLFAFMAAPVMKGEPPIVPNLNVYGFFDAEQLGGDKDLLAIVPAAAALLSFAVISTVYAAVLAVLQFKGGKVARWLAHYASALCYLCVIICTSVISVKFNAFAQGVDDIKGSFVGVTIALTVVFLLLHIASLVGCKLFDIETVSPEERKQAIQRFREFVLSCVQHFVQWGPNVKEYRAYKKQFKSNSNDYKQYKQERKTFVVREVKQIPIRNYAAGVLNIVVLACLLLGVIPVVGKISGTSSDDGYISASELQMTKILSFVFLIVAALAFIFTVVSTILSFSKKWRGAKAISVVNLFVAAVYFAVGIMTMLTLRDGFVFVLISAIALFIFAFASLMAVVARVNRVRRRIAREYDERIVAENDPAHYAVVRHMAALSQTRKKRGNAFGKILCVVMLCCFVAAFAFGSVSATYRMIYSGQIDVLEEYREEYDELNEKWGNIYSDWCNLSYEEQEVGFLEYACEQMGITEYDEQFAIENNIYGSYYDHTYVYDLCEYSALQNGWAVRHSAGLMQIGSGPDLTVVYVCLFYAFGLIGFVFACVAVGEIFKRRNDAGGWCCTAFAFALFLLLYNIVMQILQPSVFTGLPIGTLGLTLSIILFIVTAFLAILVATYSPIADFLAAVREYDSERNAKPVEPLSAE